MRLIDADALIPTQVHTVVVLKDGREQLESVLYAEQVDDAPTVEPASPWHRVEDGDLPKNGESVLVYCEMTGGIIKSTYSEFVKDGKRIYSRFGGQLRKYWMPLPEPPKEDE